MTKTTLCPIAIRILALLAFTPFAACSTSDSAPSPGAQDALHDPPAAEAGTAKDTSSNTASTIRIAAGEPSAFTDVHGTVWGADTGFSGGVAYTTPSLLGIAGTDTPQLYNSERYGDGAGFSYAFPIPPGAYVVTLKFAEVYVTGPGQRLFNVAIEGQSVLSEFDIYASAGGASAAVDRTFSVTIGSAAHLRIDFTPGSAQNPKVDAIEIIPARGSDGDAGDAGGDSGGSTCTGESCSAYGQCQMLDGSAYCQCNNGYYASGMTCQSGSPDVTVDGTKSSGMIDTKNYGVDCPDCLNPATTANPAFVSMLKEVTGGKGLIRLHGWGMVTQGSGQCWLNSDGSWNAPKIKAALAPLVQAGFPLLINIPAGPGGDGDTNADTLAAMGASLARIINVDSHFGVKYIELPNEQENTVGADQMAALLSKASSAIKAVDPTIMVGGPATAWINAGYIASVVQAFPGIDFVSCHTYGGDGAQSDALSYERGLQTRADVQALRSSVDAVSHGRHLPVFLDEYNIGWNYAPAIYDHRGAVYDTIIQGTLMTGGGEASAIWDVSPGHDMSIVDPNLNLHAPARLFTVLNQYGHGELMPTTIASPTATYAFATSDSSMGVRTVVLANMTTSTSTLRIATIGWAPRGVSQYQVDANGYAGPTSVSWSSLAGGVVVPAESVVMIVSQGR